MNEQFNDGEDFQANAQEGKRVRENKQTGEVEEYEPGDNQPESDVFLFEEEIKEGDEFMAVKPWIGAVKEPDNHPEPDPSPPDACYTLEYAYGYRCQDSRQNVYYNSSGQICYMTACLGVILDKESNTQTFFGGGEVENKSKQVASDKEHHNNDIMCMDVNTSGGRDKAVTGQVGKSPAVFIWDTATGEKIARFKLMKAARAVAAVCISPNGDYIATADKHNDHNVCIFKSSDQSLVFTDKGGPDEIFDLAFSKKDGDVSCWSGGKKHFAHWSVENMEKKKGVFGGNGEPTSFAALTADDQGRCYAGGANSLIYVWQGRSCKQTLGFHGRGFIGAIIWVDGMLYSGGRDGRVCVTDTSTMECKQAIEFGTLPRAIDVHDGKLVVGLRTGSIVEADL